MLKLTDKLICFIISKIEYRISKKENKVGEKNNISERLSLYRDLLDKLDNYKIKNGTITFRHYRYFSLNIDDFKPMNIDEL